MTTRHQRAPRPKRSQSALPQVQGYLQLAAAPGQPTLSRCSSSLSGSSAAVWASLAALDTSSLHSLSACWNRAGCSSSSACSSAKR
jgi:hypothetical protein